MVFDLIGGATLAIRRGCETPFVHGRVKTPNASPQAIELNPRCSGQTHFNGARTGPGNENREYGCAFRILCSPFYNSFTEPRGCPVYIGHLIISVLQAHMDV